MLADISIVLVTLIPVMLIGKTIAIQVNEHPWFVASVQTAISAATGYMIATVFTFSVPIVVAGMILGPLTITILALINTKMQKRRTLSGKYGEEARWAAEIVDEGDPEFAFAVKTLSNRELREIGIIADTKDELRELTIERLDEVSDDSVPEDFAQ